MAGVHTWRPTVYFFLIFCGVPFRIFVCFSVSVDWYSASTHNFVVFVYSSNLISKHGFFVKQWSSEAKGKHLDRHRVPDNKLEVYSDLNPSIKVTLTLLHYFKQESSSQFENGSRIQDLHC